MRLCLLFALIAGCLANRQNEVSHRKEAALLSNRVPTGDGQGIVHNAICVGCEDLVNEVKGALANPQVIANLKSTLKQICPYFGGAEQDCVNLIDDDLVSLIHRIQPFFENATKTCTETRFCSSTDAIAAKKLLLKYGKRFVSKVRSGGSILCEECEFVVTEFKSLLDDKEQQARIKQWLLGACSRCPAQDKCKAVINEQFDNIIKMIDEQLSNPKQVCGQLGLCKGRSSLLNKWNQLTLSVRSKANEGYHASKSPKTAAMLKQFHATRKGGIGGGCVVCKFSFEFLEDFMVTNNASLMAIVEEVQKICDKFPHDVDLQCRDFLAIYGKATLIMTIKNYLKPETICRDIQACSVDQVLMINQIKLNKVEGAAVCEACEAALGVLKIELNRKDVQEEMNKGLISLTCDHINPEYKPQCRQLIEGYMGQVWQVLDDAIDADKTCKAIKAC